LKQHEFFGEFILYTVKVALNPRHARLLTA
jgi:hypothetical protein